METAAVVGAIREENCSYETESESARSSFESSRPSQAVWPAQVEPQPVTEKPASGGFCNSADGLQTPDFADFGPKCPKVSGHLLKYSRFPETPIGDRVR